jgi:hypothetical protein
MTAMMITNSIDANTDTYFVHVHTDRHTDKQKCRVKITQRMAPTNTSIEVIVREVSSFLADHHHHNQINNSRSSHAETYRLIDAQTHGNTDTQTQIHTDRQTHRQRQRQTHTRRVARKTSPCVPEPICCCSTYSPTTFGDDISACMRGMCGCVRVGRHRKNRPLDKKKRAGRPIVCLW